MEIVYEIFSSKLVSRLNGMVDQVKQSSLMTTGIFL
jgi:hypothetical protein